MRFKLAASAALVAVPFILLGAPANAAKANVTNFHGTFSGFEEVGALNAETGAITGGDVRPLPGQHITAGDFDALVAVLDSDSAYGNIHTTNFPAGEIR